MSKPKSLSITTRGIGLGTCYLCYIAAMENIEPPVYAMYRLFLGLAEAKIWSYSYHHNDPEIGPIYQCNIALCVLERPQNMTIVPAPIKQIIDAMTQIAHNGTLYMPVVAAQVLDAAGRLVPRPENLLLSSLREVVLALSSPETPAAYRAAFKANCPIPGAIWDDDVLTNADEIIPEGYNLEKDLSDEMWPVVKFLTRLREKYPQMASGPLLRKGTLGSEGIKAALVTSRMGDLHAMPREPGETVQQYCNRCHPLGGFMADFYTLGKLSEVDRVAGQVALLGELPNEELLGDLAGPVMSVHGLRHCSDEFLVYGDYSGSLMETHEALLFPAPPQPADDEVAMPPRRDHRYGRGRGPRKRWRYYQQEQE